MSIAIVRRTIALLLSVFLLLLLSLLSACTSGSASSTSSTPTRTSGTPLPKSTLSLPDEGVAATVPVGAHPDIVVESGNASQLTLVGADTENLSTTSYAIPYKKKGNQVLINFGQTISQPIEIQMPRAANLTVTLTAGNVVVDSIQGQVAITLNNGTIQVKNFTPHGTSTIEAQSGTINVTFAKKASCSLKIQTDFGAIVSGYPAIKEKRNNMKAEASGTISNGDGATVKLTTGYGSITIGPA